MASTRGVSSLGNPRFYLITTVFRSSGVLRLVIRIIAPKFRRIITPWFSGSNIPRRNVEKCRVLLSLAYISSVCLRMCALDGRLSTRSTWLYGVTSNRGASYLQSASSEHQINLLFGVYIDLLMHHLTVKTVRTSDYIASDSKIHNEHRLKRRRKTVLA